MSRVAPAESPPSRLSRREVAAAAVGFALLLAVFFAPALGGGVLYSADFYGSDLLDLNLPRRVLAARALLAGRIPHWTPLLGNGFPLLAEGQAGVFYPPNLVYLLLPPGPATNASILLALGIALVGCYLLGRLHGLRPEAAGLGAVAFGLGAGFVVRLKHLNMISAFCWLPLLWGCVEGALRRPGWGWLAAIGLVFAMPLLAGHPHAAAVELVATGLYGLFRIAAGRPSPGRVAAWAGTVAGGVVMAGFLAAVQLLPTWELVKLSGRGEPMAWADATAYPFRPVDLVLFLRPFAEGNPARAGVSLENLAEEGVFWEKCAYVGLIPLALGLAAPLVRRDRRTGWLAAGLGVFLLLALGRYGGLYWLLWRFVPGFDRFRFPSRFLVPAALLLALLAAFGLDRLMGGLGRGKGRVVGAVLILVAAADLWRVHHAYNAYVGPEWFEPPLSASLVGKGRVYSPTAGGTWQRIYRWAGGWKGDLELLRAHRETLHPDGNALYGIPSVADKALREGGIELERYAELHRRLEEALGGLGERLVVGEEAVRLLRLQGASVLLSFHPVVGQGIELFYEREVHPKLPGPLRLYRIRRPVPRVRAVCRALPVESGRQALEKILDPAYSPEGEVVIEGRSPEERPPASGRAAGSARIARDEGSAVEIEAELPAPGYVVLADTWHPAWRALVDGSEAEVLRADFAFRAVAVPAGRHRVRMAFSSPAFTAGATITLGTLAVLGCTAILGALQALKGRKSCIASRTPGRAAAAGCRSQHRPTPPA